MMSLQDTAGADISAMAILHLAPSTPANVRHAMWDPMEFLDMSLATGKPDWVDGTMTAPDTPGLGVESNVATLGDPFAVYTA